MASIQFISEIKENAVTNSNTTTSIVTSVSAEIPREVVSHIPKINFLKRTIQQIRKKDFPVQFLYCVKELKIPDTYKITEKIVYLDSGTDNIRV